MRAAGHTGRTGRARQVFVGFGHHGSWRRSGRLTQARCVRRTTSPAFHAAPARRDRPVLRPGPTARSGGPVLWPVRSSPAVLPGERTVATEQFVRNDRETFSAALGSGGPWDRAASARAPQASQATRVPLPPHQHPRPPRGGTSAYTRVAAEAPLRTPRSAWARRPAGAGHSPSPTTSADGAGPDGTSLGGQGSTLDRPRASRRRTGRPCRAA